LQLQDLKIPISTTRQQNSVSSRSSSSLRKSSGSYSIYSTFGGDESIYSVESNKKEVQGSSVDSFTTVVTTVTTNGTFENDDDDDNSTDSKELNDEEEDDEDDDDAFVDATGFSQEDIEKEKLNEMNNSLTKRLSGGHFGSAGGLVLSIHPENDSNNSPPPVPPVQEQYKRKSRNSPTDEELAKSMLNWKRHSDSSKRWSATRQMIEDKHSSSATVIDMRLLNNPPMNDTELFNNQEIDEEEEELSIPDKMALRKKAEEALSGSTTPTQQEEEKTATLKSFPTTTTLASLSSSSTLNEHEAKAISNAELFGKTLDDVWKTSESTLDLLNDPKSMELHSSIQNNENNSDKIEEKIKDTALSLWKEDETVVSKEKMAEWLGQG
jgi:hypothetical protein